MSDNPEERFIKNFKLAKCGNSLKSPAYKCPMKSNINSQDENSKTEKSVISGSSSTSSNASPTAACIKHEENIRANFSPAQVITPKSNRFMKKKFTALTFKSPFRSPVQNSPAGTVDSLEKELALLLEKEAILDSNIKELEGIGYDIQEIQVHIDNLHKYNEIKDASQIVMGRIAEIQGVSLQDIHLKYNAPMEDQ